MPAPDPGGTEHDALRLVAAQARGHIGCATAGVTMVQRDGHPLILGTSLLGRQLEEAQWSAGQGPGFDAMRQLQVFNVSCLLSSTLWPAFVPLATARGVRSSLAVPIILRGRALGSLDLYAHDAAAFDGAEEIGLHFATEAALALAQQAGYGGLGAAPMRPAQGRSEAVS